jgi:hypothetical protein
MLQHLRQQPSIAALSLYRGATESFGGPFVDGEQLKLMTSFTAVEPDFFSAVGQHLVAGRAFDEADVPGAPPVAIVTESMARTIHA